MALEARDYSLSNEPVTKPGEVIVFPVTQFQIDERQRIERIEKRRRMLARFIKTEDQLDSFLQGDIEDSTAIKDVLYLKSQEEGYSVETVTDKITGESITLTTPGGRVYTFNHTIFEPQVKD